MRRGDKVRFAAGAAVLLGYFLRMLWASLRAYFTPDDVMNLYVSWIYPVGTLVKANVLWNSFFIRPMASAWYRSIFEVFGFHPLPFHVLYLAILLVNVWLTYCLARRLSGSREIAAATALLSSYHRSFSALYFDTGYIYDVLCYTFYFSAFLLYVRVRQQGRLLRVGEMAAGLIIYICALNSKEMAVTLPVIVLLYEWVYDSPGGWRRGLGAIALGLVTAVFLAGRLMSPVSLLRIDVYQPEFTWSRFMATSGTFLEYVFTEYRTWSAPAVLLLWAALLVAARATKSQVLTFAWLFLMVAPLPIAFIFPRGPAQYYIPWFGWILFAATVLVRTVEYLARKVWADRPGFPEVRGTVLFAVVAVSLYGYNEAQGRAEVPTVTVDAPINRQVAVQLHDLHPTLRPGSRLFFLDDAIRADWENLTYIVRLSYGDASLVVQRAKRTGRPGDTELAAYDHVFDFVGGHYIELSRPWTRPAPPMLLMDGDGGVALHQDWARVTSQRPAFPGEEIITQATNLGPTRPPRTAGEGFPQDPLLPVAAPVEVRVNGEAAEVETQVGWPGTMNIYRLDFRVPKGTRPGVARVEIRVGGISGPVTRIDVR